MIEIKGFLETSFIDWPGKICSVIFLPGCNFRCPYCHNHELAFHPERYLSIPLKAVVERLRSFRGWIDGVCITGGEPTLHSWLPRLAQVIKQHGYLVKLDTNGSNPTMLEKLIERRQIDSVAMDVKAPLDPFSYRRATGRSVDLTAIRQSIRLLKEERVDYVFRMTVVPTIHNEQDIRLLASQLRAGRRFILQNFNPRDALNPSLRKLSPFDAESLRQLQAEIEHMA